MLPAELNQKYEVRGTLGAGAMGTVYDAIDRIIERRVAIKVVKRPAENDPEAVEAHARFRREAQAAGRLSHPNIVGVYDYGENATDAWIVMELVEGEKPQGPARQAGALHRSPRSCGSWARSAPGLAYSHQRGVVHRDIKPGNIMMTTDGQVKIADFGIARLENSSMTQVGTLIGTPSYMAPEQFRGEPVDLRADIWSVRRHAVPAADRGEALRGRLLRRDAQGAAHRTAAALAAVGHHAARLRCGDRPRAGQAAG